MSVKDKRYTTMQKVVADVLNDKGIYDLKNYLQYLRFVQRGFQKLKMFHLNSHTTTYLSADEDTNIVVFPTDYVDYVRIGVMINKEIWTLTENKDLGLPREIRNGQDFNDPPSSADTNNILNIYEFPWLYPDYDARGGQNFAYYRADIEYNRLIIDGVIPANHQLVMEYISTGVSSDGNTYIPIAATEALIAFVHWKRKQHSKGFNQYDKIQAKEEWLEEIAQLENQQWSFTIDEFLDAMYESYTQSIKR